MRAKLILPAIAVASTLACLGINSGAAFATTAAEAGFNDEDLYSCVLTALGNTFSDTITDEILANLTSLTCSYDSNDRKISDTTGIEKLTGLSSLTLTNIEPTSIDLSHNTALEAIEFYNNSWSGGGHILENVYLPDTNSLESLIIDNMNLGTIDLTKNVNLRKIYLNKLPGESIDLSHNPNLVELHIGSDNALTNIDLSHNPLLKSLAIIDAKMPNIDLSNSPLLEVLSICQTIDYDNGLTEIDLSHSPNLKSLYLQNNELTSIDLSNNPQLTSLDLRSNHLKSVDISKNTLLTQLSIEKNNISKLDIRNNKLLEFYSGDNIDVYAWPISTETDSNIYDFKLLKFIVFYYEWTSSYISRYTVDNTDNYSYNTETFLLTVTNPEVFDGVVAVRPAGSFEQSNFRLHLYGDPEPEPADDPETDPESLPETDTTDETEPEAVPSNPKTSDPIVASILLGLAFGLTACLVSVKLTRRR